MRNKQILISGASIAGPALACWLGRYGFDVTVVELASELRRGGSAVDFRGEVNMTLLARMGILEDLRRVQTGGTPMRFVDASGRTRLYLPAEFAGGDVEVHRFDLARILHEHSRNTTDYVFGDSITELRQTPEGVHVTFASGKRRTFDLVIGADGIHSNVRRLAFGPEESYVSHLGYYVATWETANILGVDRGSLLHNAPGRAIGLGADEVDRARGSGFAIFAAPQLDYDRHDIDQQKQLIAEAFAGVGWHAQQLVGTLRDADGFYFDSISRADVPAWSQGRIALVGDAACGATIGGMGTGTAIVAAYALAGELTLAAGDHTVAFGRYESLLRPYAQKTQQGGDRTGKFLAPRSRIALRLRDMILSRRFAMNLMLKAGQEQAAGIDLPNYPAIGTTTPGRLDRDGRSN